jgi:hypothetical protein
MSTVMFLYVGVLPHWSLEVRNYLDKNIQRQSVSHWEDTSLSRHIHQMKPTDTYTKQTMVISEQNRDAE